ncbi:MAG: pitrilysin family protein [Pseudomonadota bacterium]
MTHQRLTSFFMTICATVALAAPAIAKEAPPTGGEPREFRLASANTVTLDNGIPVTLVPYGNIPKATVSITLPVGSAHDGDTPWLADLTGSMLTEGAGGLDSDGLAARSADMGGEIGVGVGTNQTQIGLDVLSEFAPDAVALVADVIRRPALPADAFERVRANLLKNLAIAVQQPQTQADEAFRKALFGDHPYGDGLPTPDELNALTIDDVRGFVQRHYGGNGVRIYVAGRFDERAVMSAITRAFGDWPSVDRTAFVAPSVNTAPGVTFIPRPNAPQSTLYMGLPLVDPSHPDYVALSVLNTLLGGSFSSRITSNIREDKGYTYSPRSSVSVNRASGYWVQRADVTTNVTGPSIKEIVYEIERLQNEAPSAEELDRIKNYLTGVFVLRNATRGALIGQLQFLNTHGLTRDYLEGYVKRVNAVTPEQVRELAERYLPVDAMTLVVVGDPDIVPDQLEALEKPAS